MHNFAADKKEKKMSIIEELREFLKNTPKEELEKVWDSLGEDTENDIFIEEYLEIVNSYNGFSVCDTKFDMEGFECEIDATFMDHAA